MANLTFNHKNTFRDYMPYKSSRRNRDLLMDNNDYNEIAKMYEDRRKDRNSENLKLLNNIANGKNYHKNQKAILQEVEKLAVQNNDLHKELIIESNCVCKINAKPVIKDSESKKVIKKKRRRPKNPIIDMLLSVNGEKEKVEEEVTIIEVKKPLLDFSDKKTWIGIAVVGGLLYFMNKN